MKKWLLIATALLLGAVSAFGQSASKTLTINVVGNSVSCPISCNLGWTQIPNTQLSTVNPGYSDILGTTNDQGFPSWSSGTMDTRRSRLLFHGGGHTDYFGNELYAIDLTGTPRPLLIKDASHGSALSNLNNLPAPEAYSDGAPSARHTYSGYIYLPIQDLYWLFGAFRSKNGDSTNVQWLFNPRSGTTVSGSTGWTQLVNTGPNNASNGSVPLYAYDHVTNTIFGVEDNVPNFWQWSPSTQAWTLLNGSSHACPSTSSSTAAIDEARRFFYCIGIGNSGPTFWKVSLNSPFTETNLGTPAGCSALTNAEGPGFAYDPINQDLVGWVGGNNVITYNPDSNVCTTISNFTGGPGAAQPRGTFGKWQYDPSTGGFLLASDANVNIFYFRRTDQTTAANMDWAHRSTAAGVVSTQTFDSASLYVAVNHGPGCYPSTATNPVSTHPLCEQDTSVFRSGTASMRFVAPAKSEDRPNGFYAQYFGVDFQQNTDIYITVAQRMNAGYLLAMPAVGGGTTYLKNHIFTNSNINTGGATFNSCGQPSMVVVNANNNGYPVQYLDCGTPTLDMGCPNSTTCDEYDQNFINGTTTGAQGFTCVHGTPQPSPNCFDYPVNTWVAWYYHIHIGTWGVANSLFESFVSTPTSPSWRQWLYRPNQVFANDGGGTPLPFNTAQLLSYWTNRDGTVCAPGCVDGTQWYDEWIVSTQPIMYPQAPPAVP